MSEEYAKQLWVYIGRREGTEGPVDSYVGLSSDGFPTSGVKSYKSRKLVRAIGAVYEVETVADGSRARVAAAVFVRQLACAGSGKIIAAWRLEHDAYETSRRLEQAEKRCKAEALSYLDPLREVYRSAPFTERTAIEVVVLSYLRWRL